MLFSSCKIKNLDRSGPATQLFLRIALAAHFAMSRISPRHAFKGEMLTSKGLVMVPLSSPAVFSLK